MEDITIRQIASGTWMLDDLFGCHRYLLAGTERALLIDAGGGSLGIAGAIRSLTHLPVDLLLTHGHLDHLGDAWFGRYVYLYPADEALYAAHRKPEKRAGFLCETLARKQGDRMDTAAQRKYCQAILRQVPDRTTPLAESSLNLGGRTIQVLHTPGHTIGSICVWDASTSLLFTGDTLCEMGVLLHFPESAALEDYKRSLKKLQSLTGIRQIYGGHHRVPSQPTLIEQYLELCHAVQAGTLEKQIGGANIYSTENLWLSLP